MNALRLSGIEMAFGGVRALQGFDLAVKPGEIHGLIGPNGAGKTTAINVISGLLRPQRGHLELRDAPFQPRARDLARLRIARTFQTAAIFGDLNAVENVVLGAYAESRSGVASGALHSPAMLREELTLHERAKTLLTLVGFDDVLDEPARSLSFASQRKLEVARALMHDPRLLLLDEPTAGLAASEVTQFARLLRELRDRSDITILLIEHNVPFIFGLCDRVTAMHEGRAIATGDAAEVRRDPEVVASYLGESAPETAPASAVPRTAVEGPPLLEIRDVNSGYGATTIVREATLTVAAGEIVALFGRNGAGKSTLLNTVAGLIAPKSGSILWRGASIGGKEADKVVAAGIGLVPQERSVIARQTVDDNLALATFGLRLSSAERKARHARLMERFPRLAQRREQLAGSLSGGERQMLAIAKVLMRAPKLLMLDEPSIGLAPSVVAEVRDIVAALGREGLPILVAEQNVGWLVPLAHRAYLIDTGRIISEGLPHVLAESGALAERYLGA